MISVAYLVSFSNEESFKENIKSLKNFLFSYQLYQAGVVHKLFILIKGRNVYEHINKIREIVPLNIPIIKLSDEVCDFGSFTEFARYRAESYMFILNQHSVIRTQNWLKIYNTTLKKTKSKIVASTTSLYSCADAHYIKINNLISFIKYFPINILNKIRSLYFSRKFLKYPNPHIRLNALLIKTSLWLEYFKDLNIKFKFQCCEIESGKNSFYFFLKKKKEIIPIVRNDEKYITNYLR
jgi:hypothetical protein